MYNKYFFVLTFVYYDHTHHDDCSWITICNFLCLSLEDFRKNSFILNECILDFYDMHDFNIICYLFDINLILPCICGKSR